MITFLAYLGAAITEIAGCFAFWAWLRLDKSVLWLLPGTFSLLIFAYLLTFVEADFAGRAFAAYGAIYILASIFWMWIIEGNAPDRFDIIGVLVCLIGAWIIMFVPRV